MSPSAPATNIVASAPNLPPIEGLPTEARQASVAATVHPPLRHSRTPTTLGAGLSREAELKTVEIHIGSVEIHAAPAPAAPAAAVPASGPAAISLDAFLAGGRQ